MNNESQYISIGEASRLIGVSVVTLRRWEKLGKLKSIFRTFGNHRRYNKIELESFIKNKKRLVIGYARVSSTDQKKRP